MNQYAKFEGPLFKGVVPSPFVIVFKNGELHGHYLGKRKLSVLNYLKRELERDAESFDLEKLVHRVGGVYYKIGVYKLTPEIEEGLHRMYPIKDTPEKAVDSSLKSAAKWARGVRKIG
jgi:hypothetical protein